MSDKPKSDKTLFKEVINPPFTVIAFIYFMFFSFALAVWAAFDFTAAFVTMAILTVAMVLIWRKLRMVITIDDELRIDRAHISLKYVQLAKVVDANEYRKLRTINSDARSFHATRWWLKSGVQVFINDPRDKTPYWLIGSKKAAGLFSALVIVK